VEFQLDQYKAVYNVLVMCNIAIGIVVFFCTGTLASHIDVSNKKILKSLAVNISLILGSLLCMLIIM